MLQSVDNVCHWLKTGDEVFPAMIAAIDAAQEQVRFEIYIYKDSPLGERFREALVRARKRGVTVHVLIDSLGSVALPEAFWNPLTEIGGEVRWFNPVSLNRFGFRDHRKLLICDKEVAFIGGFNISTEYEGDGVTCGWCDLGAQIKGPLISDLATSFDEMFARADLRHKRFMRLRKFSMKRTVSSPDGELLLSGPGRECNPFKQSLRRDLAKAESVRIIAAYFLPTWRLRRDLFRVAQRGGKVQLILAGKSDVPLSQLACQSLYRRLLRAGVEIYEYQPQILHAKLIIIDNAVYVGSSNLDPRSLYINYELMVRFQDPKIATEANEVFEETLKHCNRVELMAWRKSRTFWNTLKQRWAYFLLARVDPYIARWQLKTMEG